MQKIYGQSQIKNSVKKDSGSVEQKFFLIARRVSIYSLISFVLSGVFSLIIEFLELKFTWVLEWKWLFEILLRSLMTTSFLAIIVNMMAPGLLIFIFPSLSFAWLRGGHRGFSAYKSWKEASNGMVFLSFIVSIFYFIFGVMVFYMFAINGWFGKTLINIVVSTKEFLLEWWSNLISI